MAKEKALGLYGNTLHLDFAQYASARDQRLARNLLDRLQPDFQVSRHYEYEVWDESAILAGERREDAIAALAAAR